MHIIKQSNRLMKKDKIDALGIRFGCDPEFFFSKNGKIIGADKVLPEKGLDIHWRQSSVIIDGVQAELNPAPSFCRQVLANNIVASFRLLKEHISEKNVGIDFKQTIELTQSELDGMSKKSKKFGCAPSRNAYRGSSKITVNPEIYKYRSAGGHIHIGHNGEYDVIEALKNPTRIVRMFDLIVGNTCVLIDRDPANIERRKVYGKAGEYRMPKHGIEYRTLSNFWLRSYPLMSLVMGLSRVAISFVVSGYDKELLELVDMKEVRTAINENDFKLALKNYKKIEKVLYSKIPIGDQHFDINPNNYALFRYFIKKGLDHWFPQNPIDYWTEIETAINRKGFGKFLNSVVRTDYKNSKKKV